MVGRRGGSLVRVLIGLVAVGLACGCDPLATDDDKPTAAATFAAPGPMPSPSEIVVPAPPPPDLPPESASAADAGAEAGSAASAWNPRDPADFTNESIKKALLPRVQSGTASIDEIRMLKAACSQLGDRACRDTASAALKKKLGE
jgi:hypothetical protein